MVHGLKNHAPLRNCIKIICMKKTSVIFLSFSLISLISYAQLNDNQQKAISNIERAMAIADAAWETSMKGSSSNLYMADTYDTEKGTSGGSSDVWPYTAAIEGHNSILEALMAAKDIAPELYEENFEKYKTQLEMLIDNLEYYRGTYNLSSYATTNKESKPYAVPRAGQRGKANVTGILNVYDDQMWIARELIRAYRITDNLDYLDLATYLTDYVLDGWDCWRDENGKEYGGITWGPGYNSKHACSNGPIIQPLVWLSDIYDGTGNTIKFFSRDEENKVIAEELDRSEHYLDFAKKVYDYQKVKLMNNVGVYWDMMGAETGDIKVQKGYRQHVNTGGPVGNFYSYNTGTMISGGAELYRVTQDPVYANDLSLSCKTSQTQFAKYVRPLSTYEFNSDATAKEGFNTWFNDVLMRSFVDAYPYATNAYPKTLLGYFQKNLDYAFENHNRNNLLPIHLLDGWGNETVTKAFHQFAFVSEFALLARWLLDIEKAEAGVVSSETSNEDNDDVYSISGMYLGKLSNVKDSLPHDIYVVGSNKMILGK